MLKSHPKGIIGGYDNFCRLTLCFLFQKLYH
eukprot:UN16744